MELELPEFLTINQYGEIRLTGHRIGLLHLVDRYNEGYSPEAILCDFPTLSLALIYKTNAIYLDHRAEVDAYVATTRAEIERQAGLTSPGPTMVELRERLDARRRATAS